MYRGASPCPASKETIEAALHENGMLIQLAIGAESFAKIAATCRGCVDPIAWVSSFVLTVYLLGWHSARRARGCSSGFAHRLDAWNVRHSISAQATMIDTRCSTVNQIQQWQYGQGVKDKCSQSISSFVVECPAYAPLAPPSSALTAYCRSLPILTLHSVWWIRAAHDCSDINNWSCYFLCMHLDAKHTHTLHPRLSRIWTHPMNFTRTCRISYLETSSSMFTWSWAVQFSRCTAMAFHLSPAPVRGVRVDIKIDTTTTIQTI